MSDKPDNVVLEHLRHIRRGVDELRLEVTDLKTRATTVEITMGQIVTMLAGQSARMDRIDERLARVERRLELTDA
jgi:hypothetical protein